MKGIKKKLRLHFSNVAHKKQGLEEYVADRGQLAKDIQTELPKFAREVQQIRTGVEDDGVKFSARDISFNDACKDYFGTDSKSILLSLGIRTSQHTIADVAKKLGFKGAEFGVKQFNDIMVEHAAYGASTHSTDDFRAFRFVIPELFLDVMRTNYLHNARYPNWIAQNIFVAQRKKIVAGRLINDTPRLTEIAEGADIPLDAVQVGQKFIDTKKFGVGVEITNELLQESTIDFMALTLQGVTSSLNIGEDNRALATLINGEQADLSESAPVVGISSTAAGFQEEDFDNVRNRMDWLRKTPNRIIYGSDDAKADLNASKPDRPRLTIKAYTGIDADIWALPADQLIMLDSNTAMVRLQYGAFTIEDEYTPKNQTNAVYFTFHSTFMVLMRDGRVIMDKSVNFATVGFPDYMDIEKFIAEGAFATF